MYDRKLRMYDEAHSPEHLEEMSNEKNVNTGKFLTDAHFFFIFYSNEKN